MEEKNKKPSINSSTTGMHRGPHTPIVKVKPKNAKKTLKRLFSYLKKDAFLVTISLVCVITNTVFNLFASYMLRPIINDLVTNKGLSTLFQNLIVMSVIYAIALLANFLQIRIMLFVAQNSLKRLRDDLYKHLLDLPLRYFDTNNNGDLMSRFTNDIDAIGEMVSSTAITLFSATITVIGTFIIMLFTNIPLTITTLLTLPIFYFGAKFVSSKSRQYFKKRQKTLGELNGYIEETITGQKVVKIFNHENEAIDEFKLCNKKYRKATANAQFFGGLMGPFMSISGHLNYMITACIGAFLCVTGKLDIGGFAVFLNYSKHFNRPINEVAMQVNIIYSALAGAERVFQMMDEAPEPKDDNNAVEPTNLNGYVKLENVSFGYLPNQTILKDISLYAKPGQKVAFVGSTGAGKTTITNLLNRFYDIEKGKITIDGIDIKDFKRTCLRKNIATVLQDTHLFKGSIMENIRYGRLDATDEEVINAAKTANAHYFIQRLKHGYNTTLESDGVNISQGQRQLLNIARAAISHAPILVLDEATSSVDTRTEKNIEVAMDRLMATRTTFVIAHRLSTIRNANVIIVLEHGNIVERGNHDELLELKGRYYELYEGLAKLT